MSQCGLVCGQSVRWVDRQADRQSGCKLEMNSIALAKNQARKKETKEKKSFLLAMHAFIHA